MGPGQFCSRSSMGLAAQTPLRCFRAGLEKAPASSGGHSPGRRLYRSAAPGSQLDPQPRQVPPAPFGLAPRGQRSARVPGSQGTAPFPRPHPHRNSLPVPPSAFLCVFSFSRELPSSSPLPPGASPLLCPPASPFLSALYKQSASVSGGKKSCIMQMGKSREEISHSENPHSGPAPRFPWRGQSLLEPGLHTDERGDEISTQAHR